MHVEIRSIVSHAFESLNVIREVLRRGVSDAISEGALRWFLYSSYQSILGALAAMLVELGLRKPPYYSELMDPLIERGLVNSELSADVRTIARSRNRLSHAYRRIEREELLEMATEALERVPRVAEAILTLVNERNIDPPAAPKPLTLKRAFAGLKILAALLFGSRARGTARSDSDYDIALLPREPLSRIKLEELTRKLASELGVPPEKVDLVDLSNAPNELIYKVLRDHIPIYVADDRAFKRWARRAYIRVLDEESLLDVYFNRLARKIKRRNQRP